jgi:nicotinamidase-related amidase
LDYLFRCISHHPKFTRPSLFVKRVTKGDAALECDNFGFMPRCLLVIDVQNEYFVGKLPVSYPENSLPNILRVMDASNVAGVPVVVIQHAAPQPDSSVFRHGSLEWQLRPEVAVRPRSALIHKSLPGSFTGTDLEAWLRGRNIDTVAIAGYMTQMCCDTTARQALHLGFHVEFLSDATGTLDVSNAAGRVTAEELHRAILVTQQMRFSEVLTADEWAGRIAQSASAR